MAGEKERPRVRCLTSGCDRRRLRAKRNARKCLKDKKYNYTLPWLLTELAHKGMSMLVIHLKRTGHKNVLLSSSSSSQQHRPDPRSPPLCEKRVLDVHKTPFYDLSTQSSSPHPPHLISPLTHFARGIQFREEGRLLKTMSMGKSRKKS